MDPDEIIAEEGTLMSHYVHAVIAPKLVNFMGRQLQQQPLYDLRRPDNECIQRDHRLHRAAPVCYAMG